MGGELLYLDSSALVKLVLPEAESEALLESLSAWPVRITSELARVEVVRATRRATAQPEAERRAWEVLTGLHLLKVDNDIFSAAARLEPRSLRSLDAIHLASALSLGADLGAIVIYDSNLAAAAEGHGLQVLAPGSHGRPSLPPVG
jgi:predicted nucleic acid-binding protein